MEQEGAKAKLLSTLRKRLQQITALEGRQAEGLVLDAQQAAKVAQRDAFQRVLTGLESSNDVPCVSMSASGLTRNEPLQRALSGVV